MFFLAALSAAHAAEPLGDWRDEDGKATIRIIDCNSHLWGIVVAESIPGGIDDHNPDKAKRTRPTLGIPVLLNLKKSDEKEKWEGHVYNAENGKTYGASIQLKSANSLRVEGCVVWPLCGGQTWTRLPEGSVLTPPPVPGAKTGAAAPAGGPAMAPKGAATTPPPAPTAPKAVTAAKTGAPKGAVVTTATPAVSEYCAIPEIANAPAN